MNRMVIWLDDQTLRHLKSISRKFTLPGKLALSEEEVLAVTKIKQGKSLPSHVMKRFLANGVVSDVQLNKS